MEHTSDKKLAYRWGIAGVLCLVFIAIVAIISLSSPSARRQVPDKSAQITVQVKKLARENVGITIQSFGLVKPLTQTRLVARVAGAIEFIDDDFREGGVFEKGQLLASLEQDDYLIELDIARAQVAEAESRFQTEQAQAIEAKADWKRSGRKGEAPALALREPQLKAAEAALKSAQAAVKRAELNLQRTEVRAPFNGKVLSLDVGLAQVVSVNTVLGEIFSTEAAEVKLPIKSEDYAYLTLPQQDEAALVTITSRLSQTQRYQAKLVRLSGAVDSDSRQLYGLARIESPFTINENNQRPLKVDEYVTAEIQGKTLKDVLLIPNSAIYQGSYVYLHKGGKVERREVTLGWTNDESALVKAGLEEGEELVLTPLGRVTSGTLVKVEGQRATETPKKNFEGNINKVQASNDAKGDAK